MKTPLHLLDLRGADLDPWLEKLGRLRIQVFREYPYLYDGTEAYEQEYLKTYQKSARCLLVLVVDDDQSVVGATTCLPLEDECEEFRAPFSGQQIAIDEICYFGESILLPELRGQGLGKEFMRRREAHARSLGLKSAAFCAVDRPDDHPQRPPDYRPLDDFWRSQGFEKREDFRASFPWKEIGEEHESHKTLTFWMKSWLD